MQKTFREELRKKLKLAIIGMPKAIIIQMMNRREKEGKITRSEMMNINKACFVKNVIMKVI
jgi:hypothetical protein